MPFFNRDDTVLSNFLSSLGGTYTHASNIAAKLRRRNNIDFLFDCAEEYKKYHDNFDVSNVEQSVHAWNEYLQFVRTHNTKNGKPIFSAQSKFEPTILEESIYRLFTPLAVPPIQVGSANAYSNLYFTANSFNDFKNHSTVKVNTKNQDFAIYKKVTVQVDTNPESVELYVPVIAIECKTYLDKTMLDGIIAAAEKIKSGNPYCKYFIVTERYDVNRNVEIKNSNINQIFVLNKNTGRICSDVVRLLVDEVNRHLTQQWSDIEQSIASKGIVII